MPVKAMTMPFLLHSSMTMCILYDKWLEPPVWDFIEGIVKILRSKKSGT